MNQNNVIETAFNASCSAPLGSSRSPLCSGCFFFSHHTHKGVLNTRPLRRVGAYLCEKAPLFLQGSQEALHASCSVLGVSKTLFRRFSLGNTRQPQTTLSEPPLYFCQPLSTRSVGRVDKLPVETTYQKTVFSVGEVLC